MFCVNRNLCYEIQEDKDQQRVETTNRQKNIIREQNEEEERKSQGRKVIQDDDDVSESRSKMTDKSMRQLASSGNELLSVIKNMTSRFNIAY